MYAVLESALLYFAIIAMNKYETTGGTAKNYSNKCFEMHSLQPQRKIYTYINEMIKYFSLSQ